MIRLRDENATNVFRRIFEVAAKRYRYAAMNYEKSGRRPLFFQISLRMLTYAAKASGALSALAAFFFASSSVNSLLKRGSAVSFAR